VTRFAAIAVYALIGPVVIVTLLGVFYIFIPMGEGERSGFLSTIILTETMFLVILTTYVPTSKHVPKLAFLFMGYIGLIVVMSGFVLFLEARYLKLKDLLERYNKIT
jgi:hypothetical protein